MKPAPFSYVRPTTLGEALAALEADSHAKVLAGGQSLVPLLSMRLAAPSALVDINGLSELAYVRTDETGVRIGALARHAEVERDPDARQVQPLLSKALRMVAHATIRNRGTTVGSIVHADASAEMPVVLCLLGGTVTAASSTGTRTVAADDLYVGPLETTLRPDEIATEVFFPALPPDAGVAFDEIARRHGDYALCGVAALVRADASGVPTSVRAGYLSVSEVPTVVDLTRAFGSALPTEAELDAAADLALASLDPEGDIHATADYRRHLARVLTRKVVRRAFEDQASRSTGGAS
ncbi:MAG TPA: FAD binding domain-containing protein [Nocardioidaceae bacterium]|nr:FAD binding domain-containing protein [Nocardioidaceae bacterium]